MTQQPEQPEQVEPAVPQPRCTWCGSVEVVWWWRAPAEAGWGCAGCHARYAGMPYIWERVSTLQASGRFDEAAQLVQQCATTPLHVIPFAVGQERYSLMIVLQAGNLARMRAYDPVVVPRHHLPAPYRDWALEDIIVTYATTADMREVERLARQGELREALRLVTRGFRYRPDQGDHERPWQRLERP